MFPLQTLYVHKQFLSRNKNIFIIPDSATVYIMGDYFVDRKIAFFYHQKRKEIVKNFIAK